MRLAGDVVWIEDLETVAVVTRVLGSGDDEVLVCQVGDSGEGDWAAVPAERAHILETLPLTSPARGLY